MQMISTSHLEWLGVLHVNNFFVFNFMFNLQFYKLLGVLSGTRQILFSRDLIKRKKKLAVPFGFNYFDIQNAQLQQRGKQTADQEEDGPRSGDTSCTQTFSWQKDRFMAGPKRCLKLVRYPVTRRIFVQSWKDRVPNDLPDDAEEIPRCPVFTIPEATDQMPNKIHQLQMSEAEVMHPSLGSDESFNRQAEFTVHILK
ncbi:hypothetical protein CEXT_372901, partial [Caerostris extrusa]